MRLALQDGKVWTGCGHAETTKPPHFCGGFVLYGAAPRVEPTDNYLLFNVILGVLHSLYPKVYPED